MLGYMRNRKQSLFVYIVLGAALLSMTFFGLFNLNTGEVGGIMARVGSSVVSVLDFDRVFNQQEERYRQMLGDRYKDEQKAYFRKMVRDNMIYSLVQEQEARRIGVGVSEFELKGQIKQYQMFQENGVFNYTRFSDFLKSWRWTEQSFINQVSTDLYNQKFQSLIADALVVSDNEAFLQYRMDNEKVDIEFVALDPGKLPNDTNDAHVTAYLATNVARVKTYFETNRKQFEKEKQVSASHLLVAYKGASRSSATRTKEEAKKRVAEALVQVKAKPSEFAKMVGVYTDEPGGKERKGSLGFFPRKGSMVEAFAAAAFALKKGGVSDVVETPFGFHIIHVDAIKEAEKKTLKDVERTIAKTLIFNDKKDTQAYEMAKLLIQRLTAGDQVVQFLTTNKLQLKSSNGFSINSDSVPNIGASDDILEASFSLSGSTPVYQKPLRFRGVYYVLRLKKRNTINMSDYDGEKEQIKSDLLKKKLYAASSVVRTALMEQYKSEISIYQ